MKTILSILFLLSVCFVKGQSYALVTVRSVQDTVLQGDSLEIKFTYTLNPTSVGQNYIQIDLLNSAVGYGQHCLDKLDYVVDTYPKDSNNWIKYKVKITPAMGYGVARIFANISQSTYFYIKQTVFVGIEENYKNAEVIKTEYYDIYGKEKPSTSEGLTIKVTTYSNGYLKKEKVIIQP